MAKKLGVLILTILILGSMLITATNAIELELYKSKVLYGSDKKTLIDNLEIDVFPNEKISIETQVKNLFSRNSDIEFNTIDIVFSIPDLNLEQKRNFELENDQRKSFTLDLNIQSNTFEDKYNAELLITATDSLDTLHTDKINFVIKVEEYKHKISILSTKINNDIYFCQEPITIDVNLKNIGKYKEYNIRSELTINDLVLNKNINELDLHNIEKISFEFDKLNFDSNVVLKIYNEFDELFDQKEIFIEKSLCDINLNENQLKQTLDLQNNDIILTKYKTELLKADLEKINTDNYIESNNNIFVLKLLLFIMIFSLISLVSVIFIYGYF
ncbi:hypothetical protein HOK68_04390 [Candidatus Woesearchaeota archaeon]|jgi:hypothetical protein|nr:hypothetical protein [Candidatus Woesearchaeota archaeon]MBT4595844.1 hypothetical protein [Candidatus Woesearchaeota archaeon]MBT5741307.1 hypothetical protein [Candidatus Woesearchaeota archaeon]MBT6505989.1 hypothetical protein [Candidatus Woesearchaeota archaeon]MBT7849861.1 hypothetical protein [Candidatus Woesearchaeota archaeon]